MSRKVRPDAVLKNLPEERQAEIAAYCEKHSYAATIAWLNQDGHVVGTRTLQRFFAWYGLKLRVQESMSNVEDLKELARKSDPSLDEARLNAAGEALFQANALRDGDGETFIQFMAIRAKMRLDAAKLLLEERKVRVRELSLKLKMKKQEEKPLTPDEKDHQLRQLFGKG